MPHRLQPTALEVATHQMPGDDPQAEPLRQVDDGLDPLAAMEAAVLPAVRRPPCVVSFSGGRDSSAVLAIATRVARREGLPLPVPVSLRFPEAPSSHESDWQQLVVRHLDLQDWERLEFSDELDIVGPVALDLIRRHGLLWPFNAHLHAPVAARARGGAMLTGVGGDQVLKGRRRRQTLTRRAAPTPGDLLRAIYARLPVRVRRPIAQRRTDPHKPWLRQEAVEVLAAGMAAAGPAPVRLDSRLYNFHRSRWKAASRYALDVMARDHGAVAIHPFMEPPFLGALARFLGPGGIGGRTPVMRAVFSEVLPAATIERSGTVHFVDAICTRRFREFARSWDGGGVDPTFVDEEALAAAWRKAAVEGDGVPLVRTGLLAQSVLMLSERDRRPAEA